MRNKSAAYLLLGLLTLGVQPASAQEKESISIHGSGGIAFGITDGPNAYRSGTRHGPGICGRCLSPYWRRRASDC